MVFAVVIIALLAWLALVILGLVMKGLFWLALIGMVGFIVTVVAGAVRYHEDTRRPPPI